MKNPTLFTIPRFRSLLRFLSLGLAMGLVAGMLVVWGTGDFGLTQRWLNGVERRALAGRSTLADHWGLRLLYSGVLLGGQVAYPQAAGLLRHYLAGTGDTLRFDARPLLRHPEVQAALRLGKPGITFRHQTAGGSPFYVVKHTDWRLYYAFDLLYIKRKRGRLAFYDNYFFQPVARQSRTRFRLGNVQFKLNDGLINVAYPEAKSFIAYGEVPLAAVQPSLPIGPKQRR